MGAYIIHSNQPTINMLIPINTFGKIYIYIYPFLIPGSFSRQKIKTTLQINQNFEHSLEELD